MKTTTKKTVKDGFNPEVHPTYLAGKEAGAKATKAEILPWGDHPLLPLPFGTPTVNSEEWKKLAKSGWATTINPDKSTHLEKLRTIKPQERKTALTNALFQMGFRTGAMENLSVNDRWQMRSLIINPVKDWIQRKGLPPLVEIICIESTIQTCLWGCKQTSSENIPSEADLITYLNPAKGGDTIYIFENQTLAPIIQKTKVGWEAIEIFMSKEDLATLVKTIRTYPKNKYGRIAILTDRNQIIAKPSEGSSFIQLDIEKAEPIHKPMDLSQKNFQMAG